VQSSRKIEKKQVEDISFRYLTANTIPNFRTISDFRKNHIDTLEDLFVQVLLLCVEAGLVKLGTVALDGMKVKANASLQNSKQHETLCKQEDQLRKKVQELLQHAEQIDEEEDRLFGEDKRGDELPPEFQRKKNDYSASERLKSNWRRNKNNDIKNTNRI